MRFLQLLGSDQIIYVCGYEKCFEATLILRQLSSGEVLASKTLIRYAGLVVDQIRGRVYVAQNNDHHPMETGAISSLQLPNLSVVQGKVTLPVACPAAGLFLLEDTLCAVVYDRADKVVACTYEIDTQPSGDRFTSTGNWLLPMPIHYLNVNPFTPFDGNVIASARGSSIVFGFTSMDKIRDHCLHLLRWMAMRMQLQCPFRHLAL